MLDVAAGLAIGTAVGLLIGLSTAPVVASVVAALLAVVVTFLGLGGSVGPVSLNGGPRRLIAFSIGLTIFVLVGTAMRAQQWLAPTEKAQVDAWESAGVKRQDAVHLVVYQTLGLLPPGRTESIRELADPSSGPGSGNLFSDVSNVGCAVLEKERFPTAALRLDAMVDVGGAWSRLGKLVEGRSETELGGVAEGAWQMECGGR